MISCGSGCKKIWQVDCQTKGCSKLNKKNMKKTITFEGDSFEDAEEFQILENADKMYGVLFNITHNFNSKHIKNSNNSEDFILGMRYIMSMITVEMEDNELIL